MAEAVCKAVLKNGKFENPWLTWETLPGFFDFLKFRREPNESNVPRNSAEIDKVLPILKPHFPDPNPESQLAVTWIGHATTVIQLDGATIITDPIWSQRCSPISCWGPRRYRQPPCDIQELPKVDIAVISHNHYDHLDSESVKEVQRCFAGIQWFVPLKLKAWMEACGCRNVTELSWGEEKSVEVAGNHFRVVCLPAQHWSLRSGFDRDRTLWGGWGVLGPEHRVFFAGDTGYCPEFEKIGKVYGPFDLAVIPIGAYKPRWFMHCQHVDPAGAVRIHQDVRARKSLGVHWGTFPMGATEFYLEPRTELLAQVEAAGLEAKEFRTISHGETWNFLAEDQVHPI